ncbi:MFS transporter [Streptomyces sp. ITFR-6]|uniref:MFS transporter n=1 Tax=Streptomyces sp. ITFR-6 TaxID=3075197 RepID=UPI00288A03EE|nr:MFS transporter [Streptomyces sp. ITFR-6]WNI29325.1 MFS transporter [Streptomyces sp. ITFR-6]
MSAPSQTPSRAPLGATPKMDAAPLSPPWMTGRRKLVLALLLGAQFMIAVDFSILNVALPVVGEGLGFALAGLQRIATAFALAAAGFTRLFGRVADLVGRKRLFVGGMIVLGLSSALGGPATSPEVLLTDLLSWRWAFFVNVPVAALVVALAPFVITDSRPAERPRLDVPGAATVTGGLLLLVYGLTQAGATGWTTPTTLAALLAGIALLIGFWFVEKRAAAPLGPVRILKRRSVIRGNATGLIAFVTETSLVFLLTLYLQEVLGYSLLATGLAFGVLGIGTVIGGTLGGRAVGRFGNRTTIVTGGVVQAAATLSLVALGTSGTWIWLLPAATFIGGVGNRLMIVGFMVTATSGLPDEEQGLATGLATMTQQVGITLGIPVMSAVATARMAALGDTCPDGVLSGVAVAILVNSALVPAGALLAGAFLGGRRAEWVAVTPS